MDHFKLISEYRLTDDQLQAIGKIFMMANIIAALNRPALVIAHNKTLAGQLCGEFKEFFPENAVEYFVSWYVDILTILNIVIKCLSKHNIWHTSRLLMLKWIVWNRHNGEQNSCIKEIEKKFWGIYNNIKGYVK